MRDINLEQFVSVFDETADDAKKFLSSMLDALEDGRVPPPGAVEKLDAAVRALQEKYEAIYSLTKSIVAADELPEEGAPVGQCLQAVRDSRMQQVRRDLREAASILRRFSGVRSKIPEYAEALAPYQQEARGLLDQAEGLSDDAALSLLSGAAERHAPFLKLLEGGDVSADIALLEALDSIYSKRVQLGLAARLYTLPKEPQAEPGPQGRDGAAKAEKPQPAADVFHALSKIRKLTPKAKAFEKDLKDGYHRGYDKLPIILPLFTHFGVMTPFHALRFSLAFDFLDKLAMDLDEVSRTLDWLVEKNCLVCYPCGDEEKDPSVKAYCLTHYGLSCMYKESIAPVGRSHKRWRIPYGRRKLYGDEVIEQDVVYYALRDNELLLAYLEGMREKLSSGEYISIVESITWKDGYFSAVVLWRGKRYTCQVGDRETDFEPAFEENLLLVDVGLKPVSPEFVERTRCFVFKKGRLARGRIPEEDEAEGLEAPAEALPAPLPQGTEPEPLKAAQDEEPREEWDEELSALLDADVPGACRRLLEAGTVPSDELMEELILALLRSEGTGSQAEVPYRAVVRALLLAKAASLSPDYPGCARLFGQLLLATRIPVGALGGAGADLAAAFPLDGPLSQGAEALMLAAYLYSAAFPSLLYDDALQVGTAGLLEDYEGIFPSYPEVKPLFHKLCDVLNTVPEGFSDAVLGLLRDEAETGAMTEALRAEAAPLAGEPALKTQMRIMPKFLKLCFGPDSEIFRCVDAVLRDDRGERARARELLARYCGKDGSLSLERIEEALDDFWAETRKSQPGVQAPPQFLHRARRDVIKAFQQRLSVVQRWVALDDQEGQRYDLAQLRALRNDALDKLGGALRALEGRAGYPRLVLRALEGIRDRLTSVEPPSYPCADLLTTGIIPLDDEGLPIMEPEHCGVKYYEPWRNMLRHIAAPERTLAQAKEEICTQSGSPMFDNFHQLEMIGRCLGDSPEDYAVSEQDLQSARRTAEDTARAFREGLELDQLYGRVTQLQKRGLAGLIEANEERFFALQDFGCWGQFLEALRAQARDLAPAERAEALEPEGEPLLDGLLTFLSDPVFNPLYQECDNPRHRRMALRSFGKDYLDRGTSGDGAPRLREEGKALLTNWPWRGTVTASQIEKLCAGLGFAVRENEARQEPGRTLDLYTVRVEPTGNGLSEFPHPVAEFGTRMGPELPVALLNGFHPAEAIVQAVAGLGLDATPLLLLDYHLDRLQRAQLAEAAHAGGARPFLLVDRVLALHLALCQREERLPFLLQCALPYTLLQPFLEGPIPSEMFFGREEELTAVMAQNGPCLLYGGPGTGKTALLERAAGLCSSSVKGVALLRDVGGCGREEDVAQRLVEGLSSLEDFCAHVRDLFKRKRAASFLLLMDNADAFLEAAGAWEYAALSPLFELRRETGNAFKFVLSVRHALGLEGIRERLGVLGLGPLPIAPARRLLLEPLGYLGFALQGGRDCLEALLERTGCYPGVIRLAGRTLVQGLMEQHSRYYRAIDGHPPFPIQDEQMGGLLLHTGLNEVLRGCLASLLKADPRSFTLALCAAWLHYSEEDQGRGFSVQQILEVGGSSHLLEGQPCEALLDEMTGMGILARPEPGRYRLRRCFLLDALGADGNEVLDELFQAEGRGDGDDGR